MNKARIERALRLEGIENVRFFNPDGALGYRPDDAYFAEKQVSLARLKNWTMEVLSTLDVTPAVKQANEKCFDKIQMVQDDKNRWALYLKPENEPGYSVYPDKEDVNRFFSTLKQAMDNIDKVRMELAHKYYVLAETQPDLKVDLFSSGAQDIDLNRIQRVSVFSINRIPFLENGGIYVQVNLRGGSEYGEDWHVAGTKMQKQNVFNDFIAAAEYLIDNKYTNSQRRRQAPTGRTKHFCGSAARPGRTVSGSATFSSKTPRPTTHGVSTWSRQATAFLPMQSS
jgi:hypothetical protein